MTTTDGPRGDGSYRRLAAAILVAHQRIDPGRCGCGPMPLGSSWPEHLAEVLDVAGALRRFPPSDTDR